MPKKKNKAQPPEAMEAAQGADLDAGVGAAPDAGADTGLDAGAEQTSELTAPERGAGQAEEPAEEAAAEEGVDFAPGEQAEIERDADGIDAMTPAAHLERLQKILAQAGVASRRRAEEMITQGRVQVNGQIVTTLGSKADAARDHIRVDGKLLHGAERHRYFVLNKPKGYVTTVSDPEGRPTVMQFFERTRERLYPVGRLDYMSEGLLLVTNDGALANQLTRAAAGVEKTYLVKVSGQPSSEELERLRSGVAIEKAERGSERVQTAPAQIRQVRAGENPWFEVVLTEGRNRELRKMFEQAGHRVEKIRRVGYGPLVLDQEPGKFRELDAAELAALRRAAEGKSQPRRRGRNLAAGALPTVTPRSAAAARPARPGGEKPLQRRADGDRGQQPFRPQRPERRDAERRRPEGARPAWQRNERAAAGGRFTERNKEGFRGKPPAEGWKRREGKRPFAAGKKPAGFRGPQPRDEAYSSGKPAWKRQRDEREHGFAGPRGAGGATQRPARTGTGRPKQDGFKPGGTRQSRTRRGESRPGGGFTQSGRKQGGFKSQSSGFRGKPLGRGAGGKRSGEGRRGRG